MYLDFKSLRGNSRWKICPEVCQLAGMIVIAQREENGGMMKKVCSGNREKLFLGGEPQREMVTSTTQKTVFQELLRVVTSEKDEARACALHVLSLET